MKEEKKQENFFEKHKTELLFVGAAVIAVGATLLLAKNDDKFKVYFSDKVKQCGKAGADAMVCIQKPDTVTSDVEEVLTKEVNVMEHLRNLPCGRFPSVAKKEEAMKKNILLGEHQTLVSEHTRCHAA